MLLVTQMKLGRTRATVILLLAFVLFLSFSSDIAEAADVIDVRMSKRGDHTILTIDILVTCWPTKVGVQLDEGNITEYDIGDYTVSEEYVHLTALDVITVEVDIGVLEEPSMVKVAAGCDLVWGSFYDPVKVPEFPIVPVVMLFALLTLLAVILKLRIGNNVSCNRKN
jgi:hypothetical protein